MRRHGGTPAALAHSRCSARGARPAPPRSAPLRSVHLIRTRPRTTATAIPVTRQESPGAKFDGTLPLIPSVLVFACSPVPVRGARPHRTSGIRAHPRCRQELCALRSPDNPDPALSMAGGRKGAEIRSGSLVGQTFIFSKCAPPGPACAGWGAAASWPRGRLADRRLSCARDASTFRPPRPAYLPPFYTAGTPASRGRNVVTLLLHALVDVEPPIGCRGGGSTSAAGDTV